VAGGDVEGVGRVAGDVLIAAAKWIMRPPMNATQLKRRVLA